MEANNDTLPMTAHARLLSLGDMGLRTSLWPLLNTMALSAERYTLVSIRSSQASGVMAVFCNRYITGVALENGATGYGAMRTLLSLREGRYTLEAVTTLPPQLEQQLGLDISELRSARDEGAPPMCTPGELLRPEPVAESIIVVANDGVLPGFAPDQALSIVLEPPCHVRPKANKAAPPRLHPTLAVQHSTLRDTTQVRMQSAKYGVRLHVGNVQRFLNAAAIVMVASVAAMLILSCWQSMTRKASAASLAAALAAADNTSANERRRPAAEKHPALSVPPLLRTEAAGAPGVVFPVIHGCRQPRLY